MTEALLDEVFSRMSPISVEDVGKCYYCGCEATHDDYVPPIATASYYIRTGDNCSFIIAPCCNECHTFLKHFRGGLLDERKKHVNLKISKKYKKALNIYEKWSIEEANDLSFSLKHSILAGLNLGEESYARLKYFGFGYEHEGNLFHARRKEIKKFLVFGEEFDNYKNALQYASKAYRININILKEWLIDYEANFDNAITAFFQEKEQKEFEKKKTKLCNSFSKKYKKNSNFIKGVLNVYLDEHPHLSIEECLELIYIDRIKK